MQYTAMTLVSTTPHHKDNWHPGSIPFGPIAIIVIVVAVVTQLVKNR